MKTLTYEETYNIWCESPIFNSPRKLKNRDDWGDQKTVGVHLKRIGVSFHNLKESDFGFYLGQHEIGFVVLIKSLDFKIISGEVYENLEELKKIWEIN